MKKNIEVIGLIYKSKNYLDLLCEELKSDNCFVDGWDVSVRIVANDATEEVLEALKEKDIPYTIYNDPKPDDFYLNRVYRCWNHAGQSSVYDNICFVNSDMVFSPGWLANLLRHHNGNTIPCSRLVESGKLRSGEYGIEKNFGKNPKELQKEDFYKYASEEAKELVGRGGLFMPCVFETNRFVESGMYPEGNVFLEGNMMVVGYPNDRPVFMSGDAFLFETLRQRYGMQHVTIFDSLVYHIQEGEMEE